MKKQNKSSPDIAKELRRKAEAMVKKKKEVLPKTKTELLKLVQEFEIHQIELEMMNEELQQSRAEVEKGLEAYTDLYDFAP
jgi:hypothetical protein